MTTASRSAMKVLGGASGIAAGGGTASAAEKNPYLRVVETSPESIILELSPASPQFVDRQYRRSAGK